MAAFPRVEDAPLIAHISTADPGETRQRILSHIRDADGGADSTGGRAHVADDRPLALISFGGMGLRRLDYALLANTPDVLFVFPTRPPGDLPPNVVICPRRMFRTWICWQHATW